MPWRSSDKNSLRRCTNIPITGSYYSKAYYKGDGGTITFAVPFPYIARRHVRVLVNNEERPFTWSNPGMIIVSGDTPPSGSVVEVKRITPRDQRLVDYVDGTVLREFDLDLSDIQLLYLIQEDMDVLIDTLVFDHVKDAWDARGKRIINLADPIEDQDAVTLAFVKKYINGGGGGGGEEPGPGPGPGPLPPVDIDIDKLKEQILKDILARLKDIKEEIKSNLDEAAKRIAEGLERLKKHNADVFRWAGIIVDEANGTATIAGLEDLKTSTGHRFNDVYQQLNAHEALIKLKASNIDVENLKTRIGKAEVDISGARAEIDLKASKTEVEGLTQKLSKAEVDIDGLNSAIRLKADKAVVDGVNERLSAAELFINANGGNLQGIVFDFRGIKKSLEELAAMGIANAEGLLNANAWRRTDIAHAKTELYAKIEDTDKAVARQKTELLASIKDTAAAADRKLEVIADGLKAEATSRELLAVKVGENKAAIATEAQVRADETGKLNAKYGVRLDVNGYVTGFIANNDGKQGDFTVQTDYFRIHSPRSHLKVTPFVYNATTGKLSLNAIQVNGAYIKDASIDGAKIEVASIGSAHIRNATIGSAHIQSGSITNAHLSNVKITDSMLSNVTIDGAKIRNATIDTTHLKAQAVTTLSAASGDGDGYTGNADGWRAVSSSGNKTVLRVPTTWQGGTALVMVSGTVHIAACLINLWVAASGWGHRALYLKDTSTVATPQNFSVLMSGPLYGGSLEVVLQWSPGMLLGTSSEAYRFVQFGKWDVAVIQHKR